MNTTTTNTAVTLPAPAHDCEDCGETEGVVEALTFFVGEVLDITDRSEKTTHRLCAGCIATQATIEAERLEQPACDVCGGRDDVSERRGRGGMFFSCDDCDQAAAERAAGV